MRDAASSILSSSGAVGPSRPSSWRARLARYARPHLGRSLLDVATSLVPYLGLLAGMYWLLDVSYWLVLAVSVPAAGFLVRTYVVFHDCAHGSFLPWRKANEWLGAVCGLLVFTAFHRWRHQHAVHHASSGNLDRRGVGDVLTLTAAEYVALPRRRRLGYRLVRNPVVMFGLGPIWAMILAPRFVSRSERRWIRRQRVAHQTSRSRLSSGCCAGCWAGSASCSWRCPLRCWRGRSGCGSSLSSTSPRTPTGRTPIHGATTRRR